MYYSSSKTDVNILGEIDWDSVVDVTESEKKVNNTSIYCFQTNDKDNKNWILCNEDKAERHKWVCRIKLLLQLPKDGSCADVFGEEPMKPNVEIKKIQPEVVIPLPSRDCNENWSYRFNGKDWECTCKEGMEQSPIDLPLPHLVTDSPVKPLFQYSEVGPESDITTLDNLVMAGEDIKLRNFDGHLTLYHHNFGKVVTLDGAVFKAEEITFHTPSNHKIDGKSFPLEVSIIHYGISKGDIAKQVILSFLFEKKAGIYNQFIDDLDFLNLPNTSQKVKNIINKIYIPKILFEARGENDDQIIMMKPFSFYTYQGSLPFPPCTERTIHYVASKPLRIGSTALQLFTEALRVPDQIKSDGSSFDVIVSDTLPVSNREIQELKGRPIFHYDHKKYCPMGDPPKPEVKPLGHYEKMKRDVTNYFFVTGTKPSGIPGAFVVPNEEAGH
jgi:carbonic anhydrase